MLVWTHEDLFYFPGIETSDDFIRFMLGSKGDGDDIEMHHVVLDTYPRNETMLKKLQSLFPDADERARMLDDDGLPTQTHVFLPVFEGTDASAAAKERELGQRVLDLFKEDFVRATNVRRPARGLLKECLKRYCDGLSGKLHEHTYHSRMEDWLVP